MKKLLAAVTILILGVIAFWYFYLLDESSYHKIENIELTGQGKSQWCWVASSQMVANYISGNNPRLTQSEIYRKNTDFSWQREFNPSDCDTATQANLINNNLLSSDRFYQYFFRDLGRDIEIKDINNRKKEEVWSTLKKELLNDDPVIIKGIRCVNCRQDFWTNHVFVSVGFLENGTSRFLIINDPWKVCEGCTYYLSYESLFNNTEGISLSSAGMIYDFKDPLPWLARIWNKIKSKLRRRSEILPQPVLTGPEAEFRYVTLEIIKNGNTHSYVVQKVRKSDNKVVDTYIVRETEDPVTGKQMWLDTYQMTCLFKAAIPTDFTELAIALDDYYHNTTISFHYNNRIYGIPIEQFNQYIQNPSTISEKELSRFNIPI